MFLLQDNRLPRHVVSDLGVQLGLCFSKSSQSHQLAHDYVTFSQTVKEEPMRTEGESNHLAKVNIYITKVAHCLELY